MGRYKLRKEIYKVKGKIEVQWAVVDTVDDHVVVRYAKESDAEEVIRGYEEALQASENPDG